MYRFCDGLAGPLQQQQQQQQREGKVCAMKETAVIDIITQASLGGMKEKARAPVR